MRMANPKEKIMLKDGSSLSHPGTIKIWSDNTKLWPSITYGDIYNYLIESEAVDGKAMKSYKSLDSFNYFLSGWVVSGIILFLFFLDFF